MQNKRPESPSPELLKRFLACKCSAEEEEAIALWYHSLGLEREKLQLSTEEERALKGKLWSAIRGNISDTTPPTEIQPPLFNRYKRPLIWSGAAAACILLFLFFLLPGSENHKNLPEQDNRIIYKNTTGKTLCIALPDTSLVWLQPMGTLTYVDFNEQRQREVTLSGEAYFEVTSDPEKPFIVHTGEVVTRVLGTKFNIKAYHKEQTVEVEVTEGTVALRSGEREGERQQQAEPRNLQLTANQKAVYHLREKKLVKLILPQDAPRAFEELSEKTRFEFNDTPLKKVMNLLEKAYQIDIELENDALNHCTLTASLNGETLDTKLELICKSIGATYRRGQHKIFISGNGCTNLTNTSF